MRVETKRAALLAARSESALTSKRAGTKTIPIPKVRTVPKTPHEAPVREWRLYLASSRLSRYAAFAGEISMTGVASIAAMSE
jgi:hypothetical protein